MDILHETVVVSDFFHNQCKQNYIVANILTYQVSRVSQSLILFVNIQRKKKGKPLLLNEKL